MEQGRRYPEVGKSYRRARALMQPPMSQERLAAEVGTSRRHIIRIENGEHRPYPALRDRIAEVLGVDPSGLPAAEAAPRPFARTR